MSDASNALERTRESTFGPRGEVEQPDGLTGGSSSPSIYPQRPKDPISALALANTRIAGLEAELPKQKEKLTRIKDLKVEDPREYLRYIETKKLEELEKSFSKGEASLAAWRAAAAEAKGEIPEYEDLLRRTNVWVSGHGKAEKKVADAFRRGIGSIERERDELLSGFTARGWAAPKALTDVQGKDLKLRTMVQQLGASPPPNMPYTWTADRGPSVRHYDL